MYKFKIGKANLSYNFSDADQVEKFEKAVAACSEAQNQMPTTEPVSVQIRHICRSVFDLFNTLFGDGTDKSVFGNSCDMELAIIAMAQLVDARVNAEAELAKRIEEIKAKYLPDLKVL